MNHREYRVPDRFDRGRQGLSPACGFLHMVTEYEIQDLRNALARRELPRDFETKLAALANGDLLQQSIAQSCRLFFRLLLAVQDGSFKLASPSAQVQLLRLLAYVRKDDDVIPDYRPDGYVDDQREIRAGRVELAELLEAFKAWRLQHQVPEIWLSA